MSVLNITIEESQDQTTPGVPNIISISTNEPSIIFYTLDGTDPDTFSAIYISPILMPSSLPTITLKIMATNHQGSIATFSKQYFANLAEVKTAAGDRLPHSPTTDLGNSANMNSLFPFGSSTPNPQFNYLNNSNAGTTVFDQSKPATPSGFDANGNPAGFTNQPLDSFKFKQVYSTTNQKGEIFPGIGNLPAKVEVIGKTTPVEYTQERSDFADKIFNPRALIVIQDSTTEDPTNPVHINRPYFSLEDQEIVRDGNLLFNSALDAPPTMGSFVNSHYNPRTNMITYYYYDNTLSRWIISSTPHQPTTKNIGGLDQMVFPRSKPGSNGTKVYKWVWGIYRTLT